MSDLLLQFGASNLCLSLLLATMAWIAQSMLRRPTLAHLLWVLVLVKLVTPPLIGVPVLPAPSSPIANTDAAPAVSAALDIVTGSATTPAAAATLGSLQAVLLGTWLLGSLIVLVWSLWRIGRFNGLLTLSARPAPERIQRLARHLAGRLRLTNTPTIFTTSAHVSPMVWWLGGEVRIYIPARLPQELDEVQLRWVLAHELAHVRRRDHCVRWLEWLACVACWWNPVAWWARHNLRSNEEICCDALVLQTFQPRPHTYANSLLTVVEFLAAPALRPPAIASEINSGGFLERRFRMIVSKTPIATTPRWLQATVLLCTMALMPLGIAQAQTPDLKAVGTRLREAVQAGELTGEQARTMLAALKKQGESRSRRRAGTDEQGELPRLKKRLGAAIKAGDISKAEARDQLVARAKELRNRTDRLERAEVRERRERVSAEAKTGRIDQRKAREVLRRRIADQRAGDQQLSEARRDLLDAEMDRELALSKKVARAAIDVLGGDHPDARKARDRADKEYDLLGRGAKNRELERLDRAQAQRRRAEARIEFDRVLEATRALRAEQRNGDARLRDAKKAQARQQRDQLRKPRQGQQRDQQQLQQQRSKNQEHWNQVRQDLDAAVQAEAMSRAEATARFDELRANSQRSDRGAAQEARRARAVEIEKMARDIEAAIKAGAMTKKAGKASLAELKKAMKALSEAKGRQAKDRRRVIR